MDHADFVRLEPPPSQVQVMQHEIEKMKMVESLGVRHCHAETWISEASPGYC
jgi:hypothetical protein